MRSATFSAPPFAGRPQRARHALARGLRPPRCGLCFPVFFQQYESGRPPQGRRPDSYFLCRLDKYGSVNDHARRRRRESRRRHRRGSRRNRHRRRGSFLRRQSCRLQIRRRCAEAGAGAGRDAAPAGAAGPYGGDDGRPSYCPGKSPCRTKGRFNKCCNGRRAGGAAR